MTSTSPVATLDNMICTVDSRDYHGNLPSYTSPTELIFTQILTWDGISSPYREPSGKDCSRTSIIRYLLLNHSICGITLSPPHYNIPRLKQTSKHIMVLFPNYHTWLLTDVPDYQIWTFSWVPLAHVTPRYDLEVWSLVKDYKVWP